MLRTSAIALAASSLLFAGSALARDQISIVGSSTVFPFATAVAEQFGQVTDFATPVIESTGSGGGAKLFCSGVGVEHPDVTNSSRRMKLSEFELCQENGVTDITEFVVGFDGIVMANAIDAEPLSITREQIFMALAREVPIDGELVTNPHMMWSDIDDSLPALKIEVLGPPPTSGTRDAFVELVMEEAAGNIDGADEDKAGEIREDGAYIEAGENDTLIVNKLSANPAAFGIFGFSFLDQNADQLQGAVIDGVEPTFENIAGGDYAVSRSLFFYVKKAHVGVIPGLQEYAQAFLSDAAVGDEGYTVDKGLIPLPADQRAAFQAAANDLPSMTAADWQ